MNELHGMIKAEDASSNGRVIPLLDHNCFVVELLHYSQDMKLLLMFLLFHLRVGIFEQFPQKVGPVAVVVDVTATND